MCFNFAPLLPLMPAPLAQMCCGLRPCAFGRSTYKRARGLLLASCQEICSAANPPCAPPPSGSAPLWPPQLRENGTW